MRVCGKVEVFHRAGNGTEVVAFQFVVCLMSVHQIHV